MIANLGNLFGPDIIVVMLISLALPVVGIILLVRYLARTQANTIRNLPSTRSAPERLRELESLKDQKLISVAEYERQRSVIISGI